MFCYGRRMVLSNDNDDDTACNDTTTWKQLSSLSLWFWLQYGKSLHWYNCDTHLFSISILFMNDNDDEESDYHHFFRWIFINCHSRRLFRSTKKTLINVNEWYLRYVWFDRNEKWKSATMFISDSWFDHFRSNLSLLSGLRFFPNTLNRISGYIFSNNIIISDSQYKYRQATLQKKIIGKNW